MGGILRKSKFEENPKWAEPVWGEIDTAIRHYDKLVVICSKHSLQSPPVIREIERALQKEDREHKHVLFPIRIDDYLFEKWDHPRKADVVSKVAGDFRGWENHAAYAKAFPRFLDALNRPQQPPRARSAGPALRPCGSSNGAGDCRTAKTTSRWKSRKAGERALRYHRPGEGCLVPFPTDLSSCSMGPCILRPH